VEQERQALLEAKDRLTDDLVQAKERAARAEGEVSALRDTSQREAQALRDALADLAARLDKATQPLWRRLLDRS
jgi:hypothetical protein